MNIGIYIPSMGDNVIVSQCVHELNRGIISGTITNASMFFDSIGPINEHLDFGIFNSTDIWNFNGTLFALTPECAIKAINAVNNIKIVFGYGWDDEANLFSVLDLVYNKKIKAISKTEVLAKEFYRLTGQETVGFTEDLQNLLELLVEK